MTDEIKEILDNLIINETTGMCYLSIRLTNQIRSIITNLQQENERLKETVENLTTMTVCGDKKQIKNTAQYKLDIYKSRCEKAINSIDILQEIIYQQPTDNKADDMWLLDKLDGFKNILNGSDEK